MIVRKLNTIDKNSTNILSPNEVKKYYIGINYFIFNLVIKYQITFLFKIYFFLKWMLKILIWLIIFFFKLCVVFKTNRLLNVFLTYTEETLVRNKKFKRGITLRKKIDSEFPVNTPTFITTKFHEFLWSCADKKKTGLTDWRSGKKHCTLCNSLRGV